LTNRPANLRSPRARLSLSAPPVSPPHTGPPPSPSFAP
jgi:hypothetical protein